MKIFYLPSVILLFLLPLAVNADQIDNVMTLLKQGNTTQIVKLFSDNVEVTVLDDNNTLDKAESVQALDKFFAENKPLRAKLFHKLNTNPNFIFAVILLTTDKGTYRIAYAMSKRENMKIVEFRIEDEKLSN